MSYGFSHDTFNIDMVLNFIGRFGEERLYDVKDLLNEQRKQLDIARNIKDINGRSIHRSQLNRFIANTYAPVYIIKPGIVELLAHINEVRNARFEQNEEATRAAIHELARSGDRTITQKT